MKNGSVTRHLHGGSRLLLRQKIKIERALADACLGGNVLCSRGGKLLAAKELQRSGDDLMAAEVRQLWFAKMPSGCKVDCSRPFMTTKSCYGMSRDWQVGTPLPSLVFTFCGIPEYELGSHIIAMMEATKP